MKSCGFILFFALLTLSHPLFCQVDEGEITLSGIVLRLDSLVPIPSANILISNSSTGTRSNELGLFSLKVHKTDTILFSAIGSKSTLYVVPDSLSGNSYSIIERMPLDTVKLDPVLITSWPSVEEFNRAFTEEFGFDNNYPKAMSNANPKISLGGTDPNTSIDNYRRESANSGGQYTYLYENAHIPVNDVLNPKRWNRLVKNWKEGRHPR
ncbi:MAG: hypothetical protein RIC15_08595 [Vicingaceae bacterium]